MSAEMRQGAPARAGTVKYRQIAGILRERIRRGRYPVGETIPSYPKLCALFDVSEITVRKAAALLVAEGLLRLEPGRGKGFYVTAPERSKHGAGAIRKLGILTAGTTPSDDPPIQAGLTAAVDSRETGVFLLPRLEGPDRMEYLKHLVRDQKADGFLINGQIFRSDSEALDVTDWLDSAHIRYVLAFSAECGAAEDFLRRRHPGVYMNERSAFRRALRRALRRGCRRLLFLGAEDYAVRRSVEVAKKIPEAAEFPIDLRVFNELEREDLYHAFEQSVLGAGEGTLFVVEGSNLPLAYFDSVLRAHRLEPGVDCSVLFFEHYCGLDPMFLSRYSAVTRPYFDLGWRAGEMLEAMVRNESAGEVVELDAVFHDLGTI